MTVGVVDPVLAAFAEEVGAEGPVAIRGGGTRWDVGGPVDAAARIVDPPAGIVDLRPEEMVAQVRAGTLVADLHAALAEVGQRTALPGRPGSTVGGAVAVGRSGITRLGRGHVRDAILQIRYVSADGVVVTAGGPTVKNVTGFDLPRLLVGSLGTLGCIGEVIVRTGPIPDRELWLTVAEVEPFGLPRLLPTAAAILWNGSRTWVLLAGHDVDLGADRIRLADRADALPVECEGPPDLPAHRWSRRPSRVPAVARQADGPFVAEVGVGVVHASEPDQVLPPGGGVASLHEEIRRRFDPEGRLNPGRRPEAV